ncbi:hypothetical protein GF1_28020 [Desulfolithobacter dissulfuricans]|uniref:Uncharacterized protein n=1 Tax=Desulfolithobacter dissulfuricans TaxID=2795293 RepID=A0A915U307_9BACT|nr:hypothetical protein [Desulfolithobacter dissulfuricans]BCO10426.1 hypothetical protein GF1_28020 [Desulfolithobacter dissulfuricans]
MSKQISFTRIENDLLPEYRRKISMAESTEDIRKFFVYTIQELLQRACNGNIAITYEDIVLDQDNPPHYRLSETLQTQQEFAAVWTGSDLAHIIARFTETAMNHYRHLARNPDKTEAKIRM